MVEQYEFRLLSEYAPSVGAQHAARWSSTSVTCVRGVVGDSVYERIRELDDQLRSSGQPRPFTFWEIERRYSKEELARAELFLIKIPFKHIAAEEYGTQYQESDHQHGEGTVGFVSGKFQVVKVNLPCSLGARIDVLRLPLHKFKNRDIYRLWGGEIVVTRRFADLVSDGSFSGATFLSVANGKRGRVRLPVENNLAQLVLQSKPLVVSEDTRFGDTPFDNASYGFRRCNAGTIAGWNLISPVTVVRSSWDSSDLCFTDVYVGGRSGLYRSYRELIVSKRLFNSLQKHRINKFDFEVVELV
jgi:hypothetical protein